ncbi:NAD(+) hydrolase SARM1 [Latimeria chalumnae]|uniref:NAD(+) hydrolase SARM1 n=1 Tax=Latimeria chalumnae TaxID=7897 RepID=UPI0003C18CF4|nr:PREDICTED: sterile alpha and TIR motif-containing protein 1 [Latimeria chalumnae]|eukprot:XP_006011059.1 PREDICTED: sterile alpha and TIR motif-containing protein 1 [Latimeria chalumnae]
MLSSERLLVPEYTCRLEPQQGELRAISPGRSAELQEVLGQSLPALSCAVSAMKRNTEPQTVRSAIAEVYRLVEEAWVIPTLGREVAQELCGAIRLEGALDLLLNLLQSAETEIKYEAAKLLEQILVADNRRDRVARIGLGVILNLSKERDDVQLSRSVSGILEHMFKHTEETCFQLISNGGLDAILYWCRCTNHTILQHCAVALANCAMYGGRANQRLMIEKKAADWLFPLAFSKDDELIRFYACFAVTILATNKEIEKEVVKSGTLELVEPFIASLDPERFARNLLDSADNTQGRNTDDLQRLVPLLDSSRLEAQCIAAFYLCVEAGIKTKQKKTKVFNEIGATHSLKRIVSYSSNGTTSSLAKRALRMIGQEVPRRLSPTVPNWKPGEVQTWLQQIGFTKYCEKFMALQVDGDLLLKLTEEELKCDIGITSSITCKRFLRELTELKTYANYSTCDPSNLADWLASIDPRFRQYTYTLVNCGIDRSFMPRLTEQQLQEDCGINVSFHRTRIICAAKEMLQLTSPHSSIESIPLGPDVFISYRRCTGSQLASLLKVHLQLRGFSVFIDVEKLEAGKFEDKLIQSVECARNFVLVLSPSALDKCMGDDDQKDWVHKEIVTALKCSKNIVPVTDQFQWPDEKCLPEDMRAVLKFNGIQWSHEYQDATIEKIIRFLRGRPSKDFSAMMEDSSESPTPQYEQC